MPFPPPIFMKPWPLGWVKLFLWTVGVGLLTTLAILDFLPLLSDYTHDNVATNIKIIKIDGDVPKPNLTVCLPSPSGALSNIVQCIRRQDPCLEHDAMANHSWDVWQHLGDDSNETIIAAAIVRRLFEGRDVDQWLSFNLSNFNWNEAILESVWRYFACRFYQNVAFTTATLASAHTCAGFDLDSIEWLPRTKLDLVYQRVLDYLSSYVKINAATDVLLGNRQHRLVLKAGYFCFTLNPNRSEEKITFTAYPDQGISPPWLRSERPHEFEVYADEAVVFSLVNTHQAIYPVGTRANYPGHRSEVVRLAYGIQVRVIETRSNVDCDPSTVPVDLCVAAKQLRVAEHSCGCIPFAHRYLDPEGRTDLPYCNSTHYAYCREELLTTLHPRQKACKKKCEYVFYRWMHIGSTHNKDAPNWSFDIITTALTDPYLEFHVATKDSFEKFLAQVGGIINLYLGFSGVSVCAFVIMCVSFLMQRHQKANGSGDTVCPAFAKGREYKRGGQCVTREEMMESLEAMEQRLVKLIKRS